MVSDSILCVLPRGLLGALHEECGSVYQKTFLNWVRCFVDSVGDLTANGIKSLLIYDAHRSHLSLGVLQLFHKSNLIVYALPSHTSGKIHPLDVVVFSVFKRELNKVMNSVATREEGESCGISTHAPTTRKRGGLV